MRVYLYYFLTPFLPAVVCFYYASGLGCPLWAQSLFILPIVAVIQYISSLRVYPEYFSALRHVPTLKVSKYLGKCTSIFKGGSFST